MGETSACKLSRYSIFILMLMLYSLLKEVVNLAVQINEKLRAFRLISLYATFGDYINWYIKNLNCIYQEHHVYEDRDSFLLPSTSPSLFSSVIVAGCLTASIVLDTNEGPDINNMYWVNAMRDSFTCNPRFSGLLELATSHIALPCFFTPHLSFPFGLWYLVFALF
jgi:hypothetical protein